MTTFFKRQVAREIPEALPVAFADAQSAKCGLLAAIVMGKRFANLVKVCELVIWVSDGP